MTSKKVKADDLRGRIEAKKNEKVKELQTQHKSLRKELFVLTIPKSTYGGGLVNVFSSEKEFVKFYAKHSIESESGPIISEPQRRVTKRSRLPSGEDHTETPAKVRVVSEASSSNNESKEKSSPRVGSTKTRSFDSPSTVKSEVAQTELGFVYPRVGKSTSSDSSVSISPVDKDAPSSSKPSKQPEYVTELLKATKEKLQNAEAETPVKKEPKFDPTEIDNAETVKVSDVTPAPVPAPSKATPSALPAVQESPLKLAPISTTNIQQISSSSFDKASQEGSSATEASPDVPVPVPPGGGEAGMVAKFNALKQAGMLSIKRLPKCHEAERCKTHWDYVLDEMTWMHEDFRQERLWKVNAARVLAESAKKFVNVCAVNNDSPRLPEKFCSARLKCKNVARAVSQFWENASQLLDIKQNLLLQDLNSNSNKDSNPSQKNIQGGLSLLPPSETYDRENMSLNQLNGPPSTIIDPPLSANSNKMGLDDSDASHLDLGFDVSELEKEVGVKLDELLNESFGSAHFSSPIVAPPEPIETPSDHVLRLESELKAIEKFAIDLIESHIAGDGVGVMKNIDYENDEDLLSLDREMMECEYVCVADGQYMQTFTPPSPPVNNKDFYVDKSILYWYKPTILKETQLPPLPHHPNKKSEERKLVDLLFSKQNHHHIYHEPLVFTKPKSIFEKIQPGSSNSSGSKPPRTEVVERKLRHGNIHRPHLKAAHLPCKAKPVMQSMLNMEGLCEWLPNEEWALVRALLEVQELSCDLSAGGVHGLPALTLNLSFAQSLMSTCSRAFRSPKQIKAHYEMFIKPREEGKTVMTEVKKKQKQSPSASNKNQPEVSFGKPTKLPKTCQLMTQDMNNSATYVFCYKFHAIEKASKKRETPSVPVPWKQVSTTKNARHAPSFAEWKISYDEPLSPQYLSEQRFIRLKTEKRGHGSSGASSPLTPLGKQHSSIGDTLFTGTPGSVLCGKNPRPASSLGARIGGIYNPPNSSAVKSDISTGLMSGNVAPKSVVKPVYQRINSNIGQTVPSGMNSKGLSSTTAGGPAMGNSSIRILQAGDIMGQSPRSSLTTTVTGFSQTSFQKRVTATSNIAGNAKIPSSSQSTLNAPSTMSSQQSATSYLQRSLLAGKLQVNQKSNSC